MRKALFIIAMITLTSCETRKVKYSGLNDLVVGIQQIVLYENGTFYLELGAGGVEGKYQKQNDTVFLDYQIKPEGWPDKLLLTARYIETIHEKDRLKNIKIDRALDNSETTIHTMNKIEEFKKKEKFGADSQLFYPGIADSKMLPILTELINKSAGDFKEVALTDKPTESEYQKKIRIGLKRFSEFYNDLDTEDRERICCYYEELMDIVGLESSDGQLNDFMYGFDPSE